MFYGACVLHGGPGVLQNPFAWYSCDIMPWFGRKPERAGLIVECHVRDLNWVSGFQISDHRSEKMQDQKEDGAVPDRGGCGYGSLVWRVWDRAAFMTGCVV